MSAEAYIALARTLPPRLTRFFKRWPPGTAETPLLNPFKPTYNPATGKWQDPVYSLRRQADLCKLARKYGVEELLPPSVKSSAAREAKAEAGRSRMKRVLRPKGHEW